MITKDILLTLTYLVGAGELVLAIFFWVTHSKSEIRKVMALLASSTGIWVILSALTSYVSFSNVTYLETAALYYFAIILLTAVLHLSIIMPFPLFPLDRLHKILLYFPSVFFFYALFFSKTVVTSFSGDSNQIGSIYGGPLFQLYNFYLVVIFLISVSVLIFRVRRLDGLHKRNLSIFLISLLVGGLPGIILYLILPLIYGYVPSNTLIGVLSTGVWVGGISYVLLKR